MDGYFEKVVSITDCTVSQPFSKKLMNYKSEATKCIYEWIKNEIEIAEQHGIAVKVDEVLYTSDAKEELLHVLEDAPYMKEYLDDERGKIIQINFNHVKHT